MTYMEKMRQSSEHFACSCAACTYGKAPLDARLFAELFNLLTWP